MESVGWGKHKRRERKRFTLPRIITVWAHSWKTVFVVILFQPIPSLQLNTEKYNLGKQIALFSQTYLWSGLPFLLVNMLLN